MTILRCEVTMPFTTALPRDIAMNTFHWETSGDANDADYLAITSELDHFYNLPVDSDVPSADGLAVSQFLSRILSRSENAVTVTFSDAQADPAPVLAVTNFTLDNGSGFDADVLPQEVALCISYQATPLLPVPVRRRRGRVYMGPLNTNGVGEASTGGVDISVANTAIRNVFAEAASRMATGPTTVSWVVYSTVNDDSYVITEGWVDNAWDTQRRRELDATVRTTWPT